MKVRFIRVKTLFNNALIFKCKFDVNVGDVVMVEINQKQTYALVEEIELISEEKINFNENIFNSVIKVLGNNNDLKIFKESSYPKIEINKKINKLWVENEDYLNYEIEGLYKYINYSYINADAKISVWGSKFSGQIIARVGDAFDAHFIEKRFSYYSLVQFTYLINSIKLNFHKYIIKEINKTELENELKIINKA